MGVKSESNPSHRIRVESVDEPGPESAEEENEGNQALPRPMSRAPLGPASARPGPARPGGLPRVRPGPSSPRQADPARGTSRSQKQPPGAGTRHSLFPWAAVLLAETCSGTTLPFGQSTALLPSSEYFQHHHSRCSVLAVSAQFFFGFVQEKRSSQVFREKRTFQQTSV